MWASRVARGVRISWERSASNLARASSVVARSWAMSRKEADRVTSSLPNPLSGTDTPKFP